MRKMEDRERERQSAAGWKKERERERERDKATETITKPCSVYSFFGYTPGYCPCVHTDPVVCLCVSVCVCVLTCDGGLEEPGVNTEWDASHTP